MKARFRRTRFSNGLTLISERKRGVHATCVGVWVRTGTRFEKKGEAGISHFMEHMLFKGTETRSAFDISTKIEQVGGEFNAFTTRETTCFHMTLLNKDVDLGAEILTDIVLNSSFASEELERERKVILKEIAMTEDSPEEFAFDLFFEKLYGRHGLGRNILGSDHSIRMMTRSHLLKFFRQHYRPDRVVIAAVGDISHEKLTRAFRPLTRGRWPGRPTRGISHELEPAPRPKHGHWWVKKPTEQVHLILGFDAYRHNSVQRITAALLNIYLGVGMSSRLFQEIREKRGLAYTAYSILHPFIDSGVMTIYVGTGATQVRECLRVIRAVLEDLSSWLLSESEVGAVQSNIIGNMLLASDDVESRMHAIASQEIFNGSYTSVEDVCKEINRVSAADLRRVARHLFRSSARTLLGVGPSPGASSSKLHRIFAG